MDPVVRPVRPMDLAVCTTTDTGKESWTTCVFRSNIIRKTVSRRFSTRKYRIQIAFGFWFCNCFYFQLVQAHTTEYYYRLRCSLLRCSDPVLAAPLVLVVVSSRLRHPLEAVGLPLPYDGFGSENSILEDLSFGLSSIAILTRCSLS